MSPEQARDQTLEILQATIAASGASDWVLDRDDVPLPQQCEIDGKEGVAFNHGGYAVNEDPIPPRTLNVSQTTGPLWASTLE